MEPSLLRAIRSAIHAATGTDTGTCEVSRVGGGSIHAAYAIHASPPYFVKVNRLAHAPMFDAERDGLAALSATGAIRVPHVITSGTCDDSSFLVLEYLSLRAPTAKSWQLMGEQLAALHRHTAPDGRFGWPAQNFIGATPQPNAWHDDWITFWREERLGFQLKLASEKGVRFEGSDRLLDRLPAFFSSSRPAPSLLHGDLWSGNASSLANGEPVIYDPACYYGDRECDLAFTEMFGGFPRAFYEAYDAAWPRDTGWHHRRDLYNIYHVLNHFHLFGGSYHRQAQDMILSLNKIV